MLRASFSMSTPRRSKRAQTQHEPANGSKRTKTYHEPATAQLPTTGNPNVYPHPEPQFVHFSSRRSVVHSTKGIVSCTQPLAAAAGVEILKKGGNAAV
jgi:gamma-glutamyltranspeptidase/glutathione hydrolase